MQAVANRATTFALTKKTTRCRCNECGVASLYKWETQLRKCVYPRPSLNPSNLFTGHIQCYETCFLLTTRTAAGCLVDDRHDLVEALSGWLRCWVGVINLESGAVSCYLQWGFSVWNLIMAIVNSCITVTALTVQGLRWYDYYNFYSLVSHCVSWASLKFISTCVLIFNCAFL